MGMLYEYGGPATQCAEADSPPGEVTALLESFGLSFVELLQLI